MKHQKIDHQYYVTVVPSAPSMQDRPGASRPASYDARIHSEGIGIVAYENGYPTEAEAMRAGVREGQHIAGFGTVSEGKKCETCYGTGEYRSSERVSECLDCNGKGKTNRSHVRQHPRRTATGRTIVGAHTRNRAVWGLGRLPPNVLIHHSPTNSYPHGAWGFVGTIDARLGYVSKDGSEATPKQLKDAAQFGPRLAGVQSRVFLSKREAIEFAESLGLEVSHSGKHGGA